MPKKPERLHRIGQAHVGRTTQLICGECGNTIIVNGDVSNFRTYIWIGCTFCNMGDLYEADRAPRPLKEEECSIPSQDSES